MNRVVLTGAGCISAIGQDVASFRHRLFAGESGIRALEGLAAGQLRFSRAATVTDFVAGDWMTASQMQISERSSQFALAATRQAFTASGMRETYDGAEVAVVFGCSTGGRSAEEPETANLYLRGSRVHPLTVPRSMACAGTSLVSIEYGITGPAYTVSTACASSAHAIGQAFHMVRNGMVKAAVAGGHEAPLTWGFLKAWDSLRVVSPTACRPFAADRDGMTLGEGAAVFTLETLEGARTRGAEVLGEVVGFGMSSDASHMTHPDAAGPAAAMTAALRDAKLGPEDVVYLNAHGTGTQANDRVEAEAIHRVFGGRAGTLPISSTKSLHGHAMGASGALELLATVLALREEMFPAACPPDKLDETLGLDGVLRRNLPGRGGVALSHSFAFGGLNAVLAVRSVE